MLEFPGGWLGDQLNSTTTVETMTDFPIPGWWPLLPPHSPVIPCELFSLARWMVGRHTVLSLTMVEHRHLKWWSKSAKGKDDWVSQQGREKKDETCVKSQLQSTQWVCDMHAWWAIPVDQPLQWLHCGIIGSTTQPVCSMYASQKKYSNCLVMHYISFSWSCKMLSVWLFGSIDIAIALQFQSCN